MATVAKNSSEIHVMMQSYVSSSRSQKISENKSSATSKDKEKTCSSESEVENELEAVPPSMEYASESGNDCSDDSTPIVNQLNIPSDNVSTMERIHCGISGILKR